MLPGRRLIPMATGWGFLALSGGIFLSAVVIIRGMMALIDRRGHRADSVTERWLTDHLVEAPSGRTR